MCIRDRVRLAGSQYDEVIREELERALEALLEITPGFVRGEEAGIQMSFLSLIHISGLYLGKINQTKFRYRNWSVE